MLFSYQVSLCHFRLLHLYLLLFFLFYKYVVIQKSFYAAYYYMITSSFQMLNKFTNFGSWVIYGLHLFRCFWQIIGMLFCFEAGLFICYKNIGNFSRGISFFNGSDLWLKQKILFSVFYYLCWFYYYLLYCSYLTFKRKPKHVDIYIGINSNSFHKVVL